MRRNRWRRSVDEGELKWLPELVSNERKNTSSNPKGLVDYQNQITKDHQRKDRTVFKSKDKNSKNISAKGLKPHSNNQITIEGKEEGIAGNWKHSSHGGHLEIFDRKAPSPPDLSQRKAGSVAKREARWRTRRKR
ncbi:hypothetical protein E3N88_06950 [Mikania micrantha]|uniref:Uncharacterized protein n=1 Tax=Mikania micrantha TaxID=192012 RepID=A0A5N6PQ45_9ASTR|nr:hypothetical protein E3N88_06950 [Mikania micrantha]